MCEEVKTEVVDQIDNTSCIECDFYPQEMRDEIKLETYQYFTLNDLLSYGGVIAQNVQEVTNAVKKAKGKDGQLLCKVKVPSNSSGALQLLKKKSGALTGTITDGKKIVGQADLIPVDSFSLSPTIFASVAVAAALYKVDQTLDGIEDIATDILEFLELKEKSEMQGNLNTLADIAKMIKFNYGNDQFAHIKHQIALDIKRDSEAKIIFYRHKVENLLKKDKKDLIYHQSDVTKKVKAIVAEFNNYHMAAYVFAYATFLEVLLLGNYESAYLTATNEALSAKEKEYAILYKNCMNMIESYSKGSVEAQGLKALGHVAKGAGDVIHQSRIGNLVSIDEALQSGGKDIKKRAADNTKKSMEQMHTKKDSGIDIFINNINTLNQLYSQRMTFWIDDQGIYYQQ